jgi:DNA gyrase/topoisomerase IV subunit A
MQNCLKISLTALIFVSFNAVAQKSQILIARNAVGKLQASIANKEDEKKQLSIITEGLKSVEAAEKDNKTKNWTETWSIKSYLTSFASLIDTDPNNANKFYDSAVEAVAKAKSLDRYNDNGGMIKASSHNILIKKQEKGNEAFFNNEFKEAFADLKEVSDNFPADTTLALNTAICALNIQSYDESLTYFKRAKDELEEVKQKFGDERKTTIVHSAEDMSMEDFIDDEEVVITISHEGYVKRTPASEFKAQGRGGKGSKGSTSRNEDFIEHMLVATNHNYMLFFTEAGRCFWLRVYEIPEGSRTSKGRAIQNIINIPKEEKIKAYIKVKNLKDQEYLENNFIIMCTKKGTIKKTSLEAYSRPRVNGINAININEGDILLEACLTNGESEIVMALRSGRAIRFNEKTVRPMGRTATGVRGVRLAHDQDEVVGMIAVNNPEVTVLVVSEKGYGKRTDIEDYRVTNRGGKGVKTINVTEKTGQLVSIKDVTDSEDLMIINRSGIVIRIPVSALRVMGRATQGVRLISLKGDDEIASVTKIDHEEDEEETVDLESVVVVDGEELEADTTPDADDTEEEDDADNETEEEN